jgi:hypothetical protein
MRKMTEDLPEQQRHGGATSAVALTLRVPAFARTALGFVSAMTP